MTEEQMDLIEIHPENEKEIIKHARLYKEAQHRRIKAGKEESEQKQKLLELVEEANLQRLEGGKIQFKVDGFEIRVTPHDELIQIIEKEDGE